MRGVGAQIEDDLLELRGFTRHGGVGGNVFEHKLDIGRQGCTQQRRGLLEQRAHLHRPATPVSPATEGEDIVNQIAATLGRTAYLVDMLCRLGRACELRLDHL